MPDRPARHGRPAIKREFIKPHAPRDGKAKTAERGYGGKWQRARKRFLQQPENVLCRMCQAAGKLTLATVVDHIIPHRGDQSLFWDEGNWQPLCKWHHDSVKQAMEKRQLRARN